MKRKITITIEDELTNQKISVTASLNDINDVHEKFNTDGIRQLITQANIELNSVLSQKFIILPYEVKK